AGLDAAWAGERGALPVGRGVLAVGGDGGAVEGGLLAVGGAGRGVEAGGVDDGGVRAADAGVGQPRLDVGRAGPVAPLARDAEGDVGVEVPGAFGEAGRPVVARHALEGDGPLEAVVLLRVRSEERRVGKECRARWSMAQ